MRTALAGLLVSVVGIVVLWSWTHGFTAVTAEAARRLAVQAHPQAIPSVILEDQDGERFALADFANGKLVLVEFIYTRCTDLCPLVSANLKRVQQALPAREREQSVRLLSISFDGRDAIPELKGYARRFSALSHEWRVARPFDARQLQSLLKAFGIVVIRDRAGEFQHNAAIHLLNRQGRLAAIFDYDRPDLITQHLKSLL